MFLSNSNGNISYPDQYCPFINTDVIHIYSQQEDPPSSFFHFPSSPFITDHDLEQDDTAAALFHHDADHLVIPQLQALVPDHDIYNSVNSNIKSSSSSINDGEQQMKTMMMVHKQQQQQQQQQHQHQQQRSSKRDRHSKITTAKGPRDRRMRLSLEIARKFFDLQDMLGFDKASKTVDWLLVKAKSAIKELSRGGAEQHSCSAKSASSTSDCEELSGIDTINGSDHQQGSSRSIVSPKGKRSTRSCVVSKERKSTRRSSSSVSSSSSRKNAFLPLAKESREKARARARERTREKMWSRRVLDESKACVDHQSLNHHDFNNNSNNNNNNQLMNPNSLELLVEVEDQPSSNIEQNHSGITEAMVDNSLAYMSSKQWSPSSIFNCFNFGISQEPQFAGFQFHGKPWEAHSN